MEKYLRKNFDVEPKNPSEEALRRWRSAVWLVKNPHRRFRMVADLAKRVEADRKRKKIQVLSLLNQTIYSFSYLYMIHVCAHSALIIKHVFSVINMIE
ncbi:hypothetical protein LguiA_010742 [Lonicera macranthoides]